MLPNKHVSYYDPTVTLEKLGIDVPPAIDHVERGAREIERIANGDAVPALPAPGTDPDKLLGILRERVTATGVQAEARGMVSWYNRDANDKCRQVYTNEGPRLIAELVEASKQLADVIVGASEHLRADDTAESIVTRDAAALAAWQTREALEDAAEKFRYAAEAAASIAVLQRLKIAEEHEPLWWTNVETRADLDKILRVTEDRYGLSKFLAVIEAGYEVRMVDLDTFRARLDKIRADETEAAAAAERRRLEPTAKEKRIAGAWATELARIAQG